MSAATSARVRGIPKLDVVVGEEHRVERESLEAAVVLRAAR